MNQTPTPWRVVPPGPPAGALNTYSIMCGKNRLASTTHNEVAERIVKCVNVHDELVAALQRLANITEAPSIRRCTSYAMIVDAVNDARDVLAKVQS